MDIDIYRQIYKDIFVSGNWGSFLELSKEDQKSWLDIKKREDQNPIIYYRGGINYYG